MVLEVDQDVRLPDRRTEGGLHPTGHGMPGPDGRLGRHHHVQVDVARCPRASGTQSVEADPVTAE
ncbi:MAG TPA: hypothetical protein PKE32_07545, partial [Miltoncostaeaceae bacterium]|nr:hypothetical protein [Miltoncostaeaceae bacterium]